MMRNIRGGIICAIILLSGCGQGSGTRHKLTTDSDAVFNAFIAATRDYYATRDDGVLNEPTMNDNRATFRYRYKQVKAGNHTEQVSLNLFTPRPTDTSLVQAQGKTWIVGAWYQKDGADPEIPAVQQEIDRRTLENLNVTR